MKDEQICAAANRVMLEQALPLTPPELDPSRKRAVTLCTKVEQGNIDLTGEMFAATHNVLFALASEYRRKLDPGAYQ